MNKTKAKEKSDLSQKVMAQIKNQQIKMHSRLYFILGSVLMGAGLAGALITSMFFVAVVSFRLRVYSPTGYLWFGRLGLKPFLLTFPWIPLLVGIAGIMGGIIILKKYEFSYKKSFIGIAIVIIALVLAFGYLLDHTAFNERFYQAPIGRLLHERRQLSGDNWVIGEIITVGEHEIVLIGPDDKEVKATWDKHTLLPSGGDFEVGQKVKLIGEWQDDVFVAQGVGQDKMQWRGMKRGDPQVKGRMAPPHFQRPPPPKTPK